MVELDDIPKDAPDSISDLDFDLDDDTENEKQVQKIPEIPLFCEFEPQAFIALLEKMNMIHMKPGQWILREGEQGSSMFTIASGKVRVLKRLAPKKQLQLALLGEGAFFGEISLLRGGVRGASVQATEAGDVLEISRDLIDQVITSHPSVEKVLAKFSHQRLLRNAMITSPLFQPFNKRDRVRIIEHFVSREVEKGQVVVKEGVESDGLYLLLQGNMEVLCKTEDKNLLKVGELTVGEVFGEISCLRKDPAMATVKATCNSSVLRLPRKDFDALVLSHPQVLELIAELGEERIAKATNALANKGVLI
jgi:CRP-like cAMP-binding protein